MKGCEKVYREALRNGRTGSAESLYSEALIGRFRGEFDIAEALLREALKKDPTHFGPNMALGEILCEEGGGSRRFQPCARGVGAGEAYQVAVGDTPGAERWAEQAHDLAPDPEGIRVGWASEAAQR